MKILAIGNSFSQDATTYMERIADSMGMSDITVANLYIGGCPLKKHVENLISNTPDYDYERNGVATRKISIHEAYTMEDWDIVTVQQVSGDSGIYDTYHPDIDMLVADIKAHLPKAKVYLHRTWAYEEGSSHPDFPKYNTDRPTMDSAIESACQMVSCELRLPIIPSGNLVTAIKTKMPEFDIANGGVSVYRDRFHMDFSYGRYAIACLWLKTLCHADITKATFLPENADPERIQKLQEFISTFS